MTSAGATERGVDEVGFGSSDEIGGAGLAGLHRGFERRHDLVEAAALEQDAGEQAPQRCSDGRSDRSAARVHCAGDRSPARSPVQRLGHAELEHHLGPRLIGGRLVERPAQVSDGEIGSAMTDRIAPGGPELDAAPRIAAGLGGEQVRGDPCRGGIFVSQQAGGADVGGRGLARRDGVGDRGRQDRVAELEGAAFAQDGGGGERVGRSPRRVDVQAGDDGRMTKRDR